jgi:pimeloyl-ACP methyl ester carboxylesterase
MAPSLVLTADWCSNMKNLILAVLTVAGTLAHARTDSSAFHKGFVQIRSDRHLYVEYRPAAPGKTTLVFANGLTWSTTQWQPLVAALDKLDNGIGIVLYDMVGMGKTLLDRAPVTYDIPFDAQIKDLKDLVTKLDIKGPKILSGLSYGGAATLEYIAQYPNDFDKVIAISPFLARLPDQDQWINQAIAATRISFPYNPATDDELYDYFLRQLVYTTYPVLEPIMLENPYKTEGVYRMVKGAKNWRAMDDLAKFPAGKIHLMSGTADQFVSLTSQQAFWQALPMQARASMIVVQNAQHKIPEDHPDFTAAWMMQIVNGNADISSGRIFNGDTVKGTATSGSIVIPLGKEISCDYLLRKSRKPI